MKKISSYYPVYLARHKRRTPNSKGRRAFDIVLAAGSAAISDRLSKIPQQEVAYLSIPNLRTKEFGPGYYSGELDRQIKNFV